MEKEVKNKSEVALDFFIEHLVDEECIHYNPNFEPYDAFRERYKRQFQRGINQFTSSILEGIKILWESAQFPPEELDLYMEKMKTTDWESPEIVEKIAEMTPFGDLIELPDSFYQRAYSLGSQALEDNEVDKAKKIFIALSQINPTYYLALVGLGMACFREENYQEAINCYINAIDCAGDDGFMIMVMIGDCLLALEKEDDALQFYDYVLDETKEKEEFLSTYDVALERKTQFA